MKWDAHTWLKLLNNRGGMYLLRFVFLSWNTLLVIESTQHKAGLSERIMRSISAPRSLDNARRRRLESQNCILRCSGSRSIVERYLCSGTGGSIQQYEVISSRVDLCALQVTTAFDRLYVAACGSRLACQQWRTLLSFSKIKWIDIPMLGLFYLRFNSE